MRKNIYFLLPFIALLVGCSNKVSYDFVDRGHDYPYLYRNGDLLNLDEDALSYEEVCRIIDADGLRGLLNSKKEFALLHYSDNCSTCLHLEPVFASYIKEAGVEVYAYQQSKNDEFVGIANEFAGQGNVTVTLKEQTGTPALFYFANEDGDPRGKYASTLLQNYSTIDALGSYLTPLYNQTNIYRFETFPALSIYEEEALLAIIDLTIPDDLAYFQDNLRSIAIHKQKPLLLVDYGSMDEADKKTLEAEYDLSFEDDGSLIPYFQNGEKSINGFSESIDFFNEYYA